MNRWGTGSEPHVTLIWTEKEERGDGRQSRKLPIRINILSGVLRGSMVLKERRTIGIVVQGLQVFPSPTVVKRKKT